MVDINTRGNKGVRGWSSMITSSRPVRSREEEQGGKLSGTTRDSTVLNCTYIHSLNTDLFIFLGPQLHNITLYMYYHVYAIELRITTVSVCHSVAVTQTTSQLVVTSCLSSMSERYFRLRGSWKPNAKVVSQGTMASAHVLRQPSITCSHIYEEGRGSELWRVRFRFMKGAVQRWKLMKGTSNLYSQVDEAQQVWYLNYSWYKKVEWDFTL